MDETKKPGIVGKMMGLLVQVLEENVLLQYCFIAPFVLLSAYYLGWFITWGSLIAITISYSVRMVSVSKKKLYTAFESSMSKIDRKEVQECAWLNLLLRKYWITCIPKMIEPHIKRTQGIIENNKPSFIYNMNITDYNFGHRAPKIEQLYSLSELEDNRYQLDCNLVFLPDFYLDFTIEPVKRVSVKIRLDSIKFQGKIRVHLRLNDLFPDASVCSISFMGDPMIEFSIRPLGSVDMLSMPALYDWLDKLIKSQIKPVIVWPQRIQFTLGGGEVETEHSGTLPISEITIITPEEQKAPPKYIICERTVGGTIPADLCRGNELAERYLCYKRAAPGDDYITNLAVFLPGKNETVPQGFEVLVQTPAGESANLAADTEGPEMYIAYSYNSKIPGPPITGMFVYNEEENQPIPDDVTIIQVTPNGHLANINKKTNGDRIFFGYRGGVKSPFGFKKQRSPVGKGILHLHLIEAKNVKAMDVGGTSDPYCEIIIETVSDDPKKKPIRSKKVSKIIDKTLKPVWNQVFALRASAADHLVINMYDKDVVGSDDPMGSVRLPLDTLVMGKSVDAWYTLQLVSKGEVHFVLTALDFGLPEDSPGVEEIPQITIKQKTTAIGQMGEGAKSIGGVGIKTVGGTLAFGQRLVGGTIKTISGGEKKKKNEMSASLSTQESIENLKRSPIGSEFVHIEDHLEKLPTKPFLINQGYKRRWFVLENDKVTYYRSRKDKNKLGSIGLSRAVVELHPDQPNVFMIVTNTKTLTMKAPNEGTLEKWYKGITTNCELCRNTSRFIQTSAKEDDSNSEATESEAPSLESSDNKPTSADA